MHESGKTKLKETRADAVSCPAGKKMMM